MRVLLAILVLGVAVQSQNAPVCTDEIRQNTCKLPTCRCSGTDIPGDFNKENTPQLVFLTFDDAVTDISYPFYKDIFNPNRKNPNEHPITGTFYITHEYANYSMVHDLYRDGHEIALHSITHNPFTTYWRELNASMWIQEVVQQREQMASFAQLNPADIKGLRAPFLQTGGDVMYGVLNAAGFQYECSRPTLSFPNPGLWPYTNDYQSSQECHYHYRSVTPCPVQPHE